MVNELVLLYGNLKQGLADATAYSSLDFVSDEERIEGNFVEYIEKHDESLQHLGQNAKAAAVVLSSQDKEKAKALIGGGNVFDVHEAQGLDFDDVLLFISSQTAKQLELIGKAMQLKGIDEKTALKEYIHKSASKGEKEHKSLEVLSNLIVGLSRSQGANRIYIQAPEMKDARAVNTFLYWLKAKTNIQKTNVTQVLNKESSKQEWLLQINEFIVNGNTEQAHSQLQSALGLNQTQAADYCRSFGEECSLIDDIELFYQSYPLQETPVKKGKRTPKNTASSGEKKLENALETDLLDGQPLEIIESLADGETVNKTEKEKELAILPQATPSLSCKSVIKPLNQKHAEFVENLWIKFTYFKL